MLPFENLGGREEQGALFSKVVKVIPNVNQTLGYDPAVFAKIGLPSRTVRECTKY